jgi:hypothetical protein
MWSLTIEFLLSLGVAAALQLLVPRRYCQAWAIWLLICLAAVNLGWIGQDLHNYYYPEKVLLFPDRNELEIQKNNAGEVVAVVVNQPTDKFSASRSRFNFEQRLRSYSGSIGIACVVILLLVRAELPVPSSATFPTSSGRIAGLSIQAFGLAVLAATMAQGIRSDNPPGNVVGVVVLASGYNLSRGSKLAAKWALGFMVILAVLFPLLISDAEAMLGVEPPWAIAIGVGAGTWAVVNLLLTIRFLRQTP